MSKSFKSLRLIFFNYNLQVFTIELQRGAYFSACTRHFNHHFILLVEIILLFITHKVDIL